MSRFFETLKEVSRSQIVPDPDPAPQNEKAGASWTSGLDNFPMLDVPVPPLVQPAAMPPEQQEPPAAVPPAAVPEYQNGRPSQNDLLAVPEYQNGRPSQNDLLAVPEHQNGRLAQGDLLDAFLPPQNRFIGKTVNVTLDKKSPLIPHTIHNSIVEQYRRLRTKIHQQHATKPIRSLLVASPGPGEGKTVTVMNLAFSFAMLPSFKVLVIDGDLRKGSIGKLLGLSNMPGLSNLIDGTAALEEVVFKSEQLPMHFMMSGTSKKSPAELLVSPRFGATIRRATEHFDLVLVDSPPVNILVDAQMLAENSDGVLLVARAFNTNNRAFQKTLSDLSQFRIVGTVLNGGARPQRSYYHYSY